MMRFSERTILIVLWVCVIANIGSILALVAVGYGWLR